MNLNEKCNHCDVLLKSLHKSGLCRACRDTVCVSCGKVYTWQKQALKKRRSCCGKVLKDDFKYYTGHSDLTYNNGTSIPGARNSGECV